MQNWTANKSGEWGQLVGRGCLAEASHPDPALHTPPAPPQPAPTFPPPESLAAPPPLLTPSLGPGCPDAHCRGQLVPWEWVGEAGKGWGSLGAGLGVGVGKKLGWAPGTSWAMSRGSSREAK